jgi:hypothetical protein
MGIKTIHHKKSIKHRKGSGRKDWKKCMSRRKQTQKGLEASVKL